MSVGRELNPPDELPRWLWRLVIGGSLVVLIATAVLLGLALAGTFDPQPIGELVYDKRPDSRFDSQGVSVPSGLALDPPGSVEVTLRQVSGPETAYTGIELAQADWHLLVLVNGAGRLALDVGELTDLSSVAATGRLWPHIRPSGESNTLRVDVTEGVATVRINDEVAAEGLSVPDGPLRLRYAVTTPGELAVLSVERVRVWGGYHECMEPACP